MENNKSYLKHFGLAFIVILLISVITEIITSQLRNTYGFFEKPDLKWIYFVFALPPAATFIALGIVTKNWPAALGTLFVFIGLEVLFAFALNTQSMRENLGEGIYFILVQILFLLPSVCFLLLAKTKAEKIPFILLILFIFQLGNNSLYQANQGLELITDVFAINPGIPEYVFRILSTVMGSLFKVLIICELLNYAGGKNNGWKLQIINPGNEYNKINATILFWLLKSVIWFSMLGSINSLKTIVELFDDSDKPLYVSLKWQYFLGLIFMVFMLLATAWYLRKFLLEYFASYNFTSKFLYWLLLTPGLGFLGWLGMLTSENKRQETFREREESIKKFSESKAEGIIVIFILFAVLRLSLAFTYNLPPTFYISLLASVGLFAWLVKSRKGYLVNFYLNLFLLVLILLMIILNESQSELFVYYPLLLVNTIQLVLVYPAFHFDDFNYISYEEEKPWEFGSDRDLF